MLLFSVCSEWGNVLNCGYFSGCTLSVLSCQKLMLPFLSQEGGSKFKMHFIISFEKKIICVLEICAFAYSVISR